MRKFGVCLVLAGATAWLSGCGFSGSSASTSAARGGLAVVDLDKVASETGKNLEMKEAYDLQENSVRQALLNLQAKANAELQAKKEQIGEEPKDEEKRELGQMTLNARNNLVQIQNTAGAKLNEYKQVQIAKFRSEIKPILQEVAAKRGLSIVIPKNDGLLLSVDPGVDITDDVIKAYMDKKPAPAPAAQAKAPAQAAPKPATPAPAAAPRTAAADDASDAEARN